MKFFEIVNWARFQNYKDRNPPWIRVYTDILENYEFSLLPDTSKLDLLLLWLLSSRLNNKIPYDSRWLQGQIHVNHKVNLKILEDGNFIHVIGSKVKDLDNASNMLADCKQSAIPEQSRDRAETEQRQSREIERESTKKSGNKLVAKRQLREELINELEEDRGFYPQRAGAHSIEKARKAYLAMREEMGGKFDRITICEAFKRYHQYCDANGNTGSKYVYKLSNFLTEENIEEKWEITTNVRQSKNSNKNLVNRSQKAAGTLYPPTDTTDY